MDSQTLHTTLAQIKSSDPHVISVSIVSPDGLVLLSTRRDRESSELVGAMMSEVLQKVKLAVGELKLGELISTLVLGSSGGMIIYTINEEMILVIEVKPQVHLGNLFRSVGLQVQRLKRL